MDDPRIKKAAKILVEHSTKIKKSDNVLIVTDLEGQELAKEIFKQALLKGAYPRINVSLPGTAYTYFKYASNEQINHFPKLRYNEIKSMDVYIHISSPKNTRELNSIDPKRISIRQKVLKKISDERLKKRWVLYDFPNNCLAQEADMALNEYEDFVFKTTNIDWTKQGKKMQKIKKAFDNAKEVKIIGKETEITLSLNGRKGIVCDGEFNMPDGEVFYAPLKTTINGHIYYEFPCLYGGREVKGVRLTFKNGAVVKATAEKNEKLLKQIINTDAGSKYVGEFGIGCNYAINKFTRNILFDEKIGGTIHLALGMAYTEAGGKNPSAVHWDMIKDLRSYGEIYINNKMVQKNGKWLI